MNTNVGKISLDMVLNSKEFDAKLNSKLNDIQKNTTSNLSKIEKQASGTLSSSFSKLGGIIAGAFAVKKIVDFSKACLKLGSDLQEVQNVVDVIFGDLTDKVEEYASTSITQLGMSETAYKQYIGTFGAMAKAFNFSNEQALQMSKTLTELTGDVSSFYNLNSEESFTKLKSIFTGETETLKSLGVVMTQAALDQYSLSKGIGKTTSQMTEQEKVFLRYQFVQDKLSATTGDFIRTQKGWANQTRILSMQFEALKAQIGQGLINALTPVIEVLNTMMLKLTDVAKKFKELTASVFGDAGNAGASAVNQITQEALNSQQAIEGIADSSIKASKKIQKSVLGFDEITKLSSTTGLDDSILNQELELNKDITEEKKNQNKEQSKLENILDKLIKKAKDLKDNFVEGFKISLNATDTLNNLDKIKNNVDKINNSIKKIFDKDLENSVDNFTNSVSKMMGQILGSVVGVGVALETGISQGTADFLDKKGPQIHKHLIDIFDISSEVYQNIGNIATTIGEILGNIFSSDEFAGNIEHILGIFESVFSNSLILSQKFTRDVTCEISKFLDLNKENMESEIKDVLGFIESILGNFEDVIDTIGEILNETYDSKIHPFLEYMGEGFNDTAQKWHQGWEKYVTPAIENAKSKFDDFTNNTLKPLLQDLLSENGTFGHFIDTLQDFYDNLLKPLVDFLAVELTKVIGDLIEIGEKFIEGTLKAIIEAINGILEVLDGLIMFITGVFTGDWEKAWEGIKKVCEGVVDFISGLIDGLVAKIEGVLGLAKSAVGAISGEGNKKYANPEASGWDKYVLDTKNKDKPWYLQNMDWTGMIGDLFSGGKYTEKSRTSTPQITAVGTSSAQNSVLPQASSSESNKSVSQQNQPISLTAPITVTLDGRTIYKENKNASFNEANRMGNRQYR